jgi:hypothetical protein
MSAVVSFVSDVVETVVDAVGDVVETVVDVVEDAVEFVGDTVQAVIDDPLPTLLMIAGSAVGIPPAVTSAAITAARGGDLQDIVLSAGAAYYAPTATNAISSTLSASIGDSIINQAVSDTVIQGVSRGLVSGTIAEVRGGDFDDAFAGAFTGTIVNSGVSEFTNEFIQPNVQDMLADTGFDPKTVNMIGRETGRAFSAGLTSEILGRGDFDDAFQTSIQNSTINIGTDYAANTISNEFKEIERGWETVDQNSDKEDERDLLDFGDFRSMETTAETDATGAGIPDSLVEDVQAAEGQSDESIYDLARGEDPYGSAEDIIEEFDGSPATEVADSGFSDIDLESLPDELRDLFDFGPTVAQDETQLPINGLDFAGQQIAPQTDESDVLFDYGVAQYAPEEAVIDSEIFASAPAEEEPEEDIYAGLTDESFGLSQDQSADVAQVDIAPEESSGVMSVIEGGLNKVKQAFTDVTDPENIKSGLGSIAMNQVLRPAIRQSLTRQIRRTPTRQVAQRPQAPARPKPKLTPDQIKQMQATRMGQQPSQKIDMSKILAQAKQPAYVPPQKVDVSKLTPVTNVAGLTDILNGNKG